MQQDPMSQQKRFLLALVLSGAVLFVWERNFAPKPPAGTSQTAAQTTAGGATTAGATTAGGTASGVTTGVTTGATTGAPGPDVKPSVPTPARQIAARQDTLSTENFSVTLTNVGARVRGFKLSKPEQYTKAGDLLGDFPKKDVNLPFTLTFAKNNIVLPADTTFEVVDSATKKDAAGRVSSLTYRYVDPEGRFQIDRTYAADPKLPYTLEMSVGVTNLGKAPLSDAPVLDVFGYHDPEKEKDKSFLDFRQDELEAVCRSEKDTDRNLFKSLEKESQTYKESPLKWGAVGTRYFLWALLPTKAAESCEMKQVDKNYLRMRLSMPSFDVKAGQTYTFASTLYMGPKDMDVFGLIGRDLAESVDYGILSILARPMRWTLNKIHEGVGNWGLAIILLTFLIKLLTWKAMEKSYSNGERMKKLQLKLDAIRAKYENDQQRLTEETMKLFQEHKFNPAGGCLPLLIQMPILYGLYVMIMNSVELYQANFAFWYTDLSAPDPYFVLPIAMGVIMVLQNKFMNTATGNPQAELMMKIMPVTFTVFMLFLPSGLVLYYFVNLLLGLVQQYMIKRKFAKDDDAESKPELVLG